MFSRESSAQLLLTIGFLAIIFGVPVGQMVAELRQGVPIQSMDLFRHAPTKEKLRRYERTLEDSWWGQTTFRPKMQRLLFSSLHWMGGKAVAGRQGWLFYQPGLQYLVQAGRMERDEGLSIWVEPPQDTRFQDHVIDAITRFRDQLKQRDIELLVVPIPGKASVYPELVSPRAGEGRTHFHSPTEQLLKKLDAREMETVDLFSAFRVAREKAAHRSNQGAYYLARDTHWTPAGAQVAADAVSRKLRQCGWVPEQPYPYSTRTVPVSRSGDIVEMMQIPGIRELFPSEMVTCVQVVDPFLGGPMVPTANDRAGTYVNDHLIDTPMEAMFLLLGDSFSRIYQLAEPASLGQIVDETTPTDAPRHPATNRKRLLPGSAGFPALLALALRAPVDLMVSAGGAATDVRQQLSVNPEILQNKKVVIWEFTERDIHLGKTAWKHVPLDSIRDGTPDIE